MVFLINFFISKRFVDNLELVLLRDISIDNVFLKPIRIVIRGVV